MGALWLSTLERFKGLDTIKVLPSEGSFNITLDCSQYMRQKEINHSLDLATRIMEVNVWPQYRERILELTILYG
ncbi:MAG TPA: hypothetical protein VHY08_02175 [Bacillota bacterium]|nr:hypothetical protein [Bacillota bacterium]